MLKDLKKYDYMIEDYQTGRRLKIALYSSNGNYALRLSRIFTNKFFKDGLEMFYLKTFTHLEQSDGCPLCEVDDEQELFNLQKDIIKSFINSELKTYINK